MSLTFDELREANIARQREWHVDGINVWELRDWALALVGEVGEAVNIIKKIKRSELGIKGNSTSDDDLWFALKNELADIQIYLDLLAAKAEIDLGRSTSNKFNTTSSDLKMKTLLLPSYVKGDQK